MRTLQAKYHVSDAIENIMSDLLAIAQIKDPVMTEKCHHALEATNRELSFLLDTISLDKAHLKDIPQ